MEEEIQLHPEIAFQAGFSQVNKFHDVHPSLATELQPEPEVIDDVQKTNTNPEIMVESQTSEVQPVVEIQTQHEPLPEKPQDRQWRQVRAQAEESKILAREKEQLEREIAFYKQQAQQPQQHKQVVEDEYETDAERKIRLKMAEYEARLAKSEQDTAAAKQQAAIAHGQQRLQADYPDINEVVSNENIERLKYEYPVLYNSVVASNDIYTVGAAAHEMIIAKGIYKKPSNALNQIVQSSNIARNQAKPKSVSTISPQGGDTPISKASAFMGNRDSSDEEKKAIWAEMKKYSRNSSY